MPDLTLEQAMEWQAMTGAQILAAFRAHAETQRDSELTEFIAARNGVALDVLAAEIRRRDEETCETCRKWSRWYCCDYPNNHADCDDLAIQTQRTFGCRAWQKRKEK